MHEVSLVQGVLDIVKEQAESNGLKKVKKIGIKIGGSSHIEPSSLSFCFDIVKKGTMADDAVLDIEKEPVRGLCEECGDDLKVVYLEGE